MDEYIVKDYQKGVEQDQARIGCQAARNWIWPYAYDLEDLLEIHARSDLDPDTRHYCYLGDEMVGYMFSVITLMEKSGDYQATFDLPRMLLGHEQAADLLMEKAIKTLLEKQELGFKKAAEWARCEKLLA